MKKYNKILKTTGYNPYYEETYPDPQDLMELLDNSLNLVNRLIRPEHLEDPKYSEYYKEKYKEYNNE